MAAGSPSTARCSNCCRRPRRSISARLHGFADRLARADAEDAYRASEELLSQFLARLAAGAARGAPRRRTRSSPASERRCSASPPARTRRAGPDLRAEIERSFAAADELNLDRKQTMLGAFFAIDEMAR